jgi:hypothetical protein
LARSKVTGLLAAEGSAELERVRDALDGIDAAHRRAAMLASPREWDAPAPPATAPVRCSGRCHCHAGPDGLMHPPCCADCAPAVPSVPVGEPDDPLDLAPIPAPSLPILTDEELAEFVEHSRSDYWIHVGSDIRILVGNVRRARAALAHRDETIRETEAEEKRRDEERAMFRRSTNEALMHVLGPLYGTLWGPELEALGRAIDEHRVEAARERARAEDLERMNANMALTLEMTQEETSRQVERALTAESKLRAAEAALTASLAEVERLRGALRSLLPVLDVRCRCTIAEIESGHHVDCWKPEAESRAEAARRTLEGGP